MCGKQRRAGIWPIYAQYGRLIGKNSKGCEAYAAMLSGIKPSGDLTLGSYLGAIKNWAARAEEYDCYYFMADLHSITVRQNPADLRRRTLEQLAQYIACGLDWAGCSTAMPCLASCPV